MLGTVQGGSRVMIRRIVTLMIFAAAVVAPANAAEVAGKWTAEFDTAIGVQKYTYEFKVDGSKLTGKAFGKRADSEAEVEIQEGKINGDEITFVENLKFGDQDLRIEYKGRISGDEIKFTRKVGDFATEDFVAKRVK
jgi:hypothetical protein